MAEPEDAVRQAMEQARRAREEADRLREQARDLGRRLRDEERDRSRRERENERRERHRLGPHPGRHGPGPHPHFGWDSTDGVRTEQALPSEGVREVHIDQTAGRVTVRPCAEGEEPGVAATASKTAPNLQVRRDGERLLIEVKLAKGWLLRRRQGATTVVRLRAGFAKLRIDLGYGDVQVRDIDCESLQFDLGAGELQAYSTGGALDARLGAGKVGVHDHRGLASCDTGTGDVMMDIAAAAEGEYRINVGMGRAELRLPPGTAAYIRAASGIGRSRIEIPTANEDAATRVRIETGIGEVVVRERDAAQAPARPPAPAKPQRGSGRPPSGRSRDAEQFRVLQLLEQGRISSQEAAELIAALQGAAGPLAADEDADPADPPPPQEAGPGA